MSTDDLLKDVKLRYSTDSKPGFTRKIKDKKFQYFNLEDKLITDNIEIERINKLAIPPAYKNVWICPYKNGHLQATGYDARGRKQYRYHPLWIEISQQEKFSHLIEFAINLPKIRRKIRKDLKLPGMQRQKVLAAIVWLLENTLIRVGNEEYEKQNKSYGLTTLKNKHVSIAGTDKIVFQFKGKSGVYHKINFHDKKIANIIRRCRELPGQDLFEYIDDEETIQSVSSYDVNEYLKSITGEDITAKDFRTWGGTVLAASALDELGIDEDEKVSKKNVIETVKKVATHLRNKPNTCRKYYIHPSIIDAYGNGNIISNLKNSINARPQKAIQGLDDCENKVLAMLKAAKNSMKKEKAN
jgi:DNA topoisomerase-1